MSPIASSNSLLLLGENSCDFSRQSIRGSIGSSSAINLFADNVNTTSRNRVSSLSVPLGSSLPPGMCKFHYFKIYFQSRVYFYD